MKWHVLLFSHSLRIYNVSMSKLFRYVALGDSTAVGVGATQGGGYPEYLFQHLRRHWGANGPRVGFLNLGVSGATAADVLDRQVARAVRSSPQLVTLGIGTNDLWRMGPVSAFENAFRQTIMMLEQTEAQVVISNVGDLSLAPAAQRAQAFLPVNADALSRRVDQINAVILEAATRPRFTVVDVCSFGREVLTAHPEYFSSDGFHPSAEGYAQWAELLWPKVQRLLG